MDSCESKLKCIVVNCYLGAVEMHFYEYSFGQHELVESCFNSSFIINFNYSIKMSVLFRLSQEVM